MNKQVRKINESNVTGWKHYFKEALTIWFFLVEKPAKEIKAYEQILSLVFIINQCAIFKLFIDK